MYMNDFPQTTEKFPDVTPQWDSITTALEPFSANPSLDPSTQYMVPRPETSELDGVIGQIEEQLSELQVWGKPISLHSLSFLNCISLNYLSMSSLKDAFSDQWFLLERLTAREKESGLAKNVLEGIDQQVKLMLVNVHITYPDSNCIASHVWEFFMHRMKQMKWGKFQTITKPENSKELEPIKLSFHE